MKKLYLTLTLLIIFDPSFAQSFKLDSLMINNIKALVCADGDLFTHVDVEKTKKLINDHTGKALFFVLPTGLGDMIQTKIYIFLHKPTDKMGMIL